MTSERLSLRILLANIAGSFPTDEAETIFEEIYRDLSPADQVEFNTIISETIGDTL